MIIDTFINVNTQPDKFKMAISNQQDILNKANALDYANYLPHTYSKKIFRQTLTKVQLKSNCLNYDFKVVIKAIKMYQ